MNEIHGHQAHLDDFHWLHHSPDQRGDFVLQVVLFIYYWLPMLFRYFIRILRSSSYVFSCFFVVLSYANYIINVIVGVYLFAILFDQFVDYHYVWQRWFIWIVLCAIHELMG